MVKYFRQLYLNSTIKGKVNIAVIGSAGIILVVIMTVVLLYTKNVTVEAAQREAIITSSENAACNAPIFSTYPYNVFLVKASFRIGR